MFAANGCIEVGGNLWASSLPSAGSESGSRGTLDEIPRPLQRFPADSGASGVYISLSVNPRGNEDMSDKETVRKRINSLIQSKDGEDNTAEITRLIKSVFDDFLNQGLTPEKAAENARIEILSWKYLFRVRKSEFADQLAQIEKVCAGCDFSRLLTPKVEVVEGETGGARGSVPMA